jgi:MFS transporter, DHA2 family, multidrug resistance protein
MIPTLFTSSFHYFQGPRRVYSAAVIGTIASVAPALGPVIGAWISDTLNWRWLFYVNLVPGVAITLLIPLSLISTDPICGFSRRRTIPACAYIRAYARLSRIEALAMTKNMRRYSEDSRLRSRSTANRSPAEIPC